jgi:shikimate kinase
LIFVNKPLFLIGYMGAGKTTIGRRLAQCLGRTFIDTDQFIESRYRQKVPELFVEKGEEVFRQIEQRVLQEVAAFEEVVISTGGGTPCFSDNMAQMNRWGITIYLHLPVPELVRRLMACKQERPLGRGKTPEELEPFIAHHLQQRDRWYNQAQIILPAEFPRTKHGLDVLVDGLIRRVEAQQA